MIRRLFPCFFLLLLLGHAYAQDSTSQVLNLQLFRIYEVAADQEGSFYNPSVLPGGLISGSRVLNEKKLARGQKNNNPRVIASAALNLGMIHLDAGERQSAALNFRIAADAFEKVNDKKGIATVLLYTGYLKYLEQSYENSVSDFEEAAAIFANNSMSGTAVYAYILKGQALLAGKEFAQAEEWFRKGHSQLLLSGQKARISVQLAELSIRKHKYKEAESYLNNALELFIKSGDRNGLAMVYRDRGIIRMKQPNYEAAVREFKQSITLSKQLSTAKLLKEAYLKMYTNASLKGDHDRSNEINIIYSQLRDSIDHVESGRAVSSQLMRRELVEKEAIQEMLQRQKEVAYSRLSQQELERNRAYTELELERLEKEKIIEDLNAARQVTEQVTLEREEQIRQLTQQKALQDLALSRKELEISRQATLRNSLIIGFISLVIVAGLLYNRYRNQQKSHLALDKAYSELSETHKQLLQAQEQLVHAQKMASLGQLTAGIAHEIQNPLNFVNNFSELSLEIVNELKDPEADREALMKDLAANIEKIHVHGKRADKIVKGMLLHSRTGSSEKQPVNLNIAIDELLELSYHGSRTKNTSFSAEIIRNFDPTLPEVPVVSNDISRVLVNLFNNAFYALGEKSSRMGAAFKPTLSVTTRNTGRSIMIIIRDNGTGIPKHIIKKIYDPFFTTKPAGQGTGLGLSLSFDIIVKGHGGTMDVASNEGEYTEFTITLPFQTDQQNDLQWNNTQT